MAEAKKSRPIYENWQQCLCRATAIWLLAVDECRRVDVFFLEQ